MGTWSCSARKEEDEIRWETRCKCPHSTWVLTNGCRTTTNVFFQKYGRPNEATPAKWNKDYTDFNAPLENGTAISSSAVKPEKKTSDDTSMIDTSAVESAAPQTIAAVEDTAKATAVEDGENKKRKRHEDETPEQKAERKRKKKEKKEKRKSKGKEEEESN